jgi:phytoene/squalene synthetase
MPLSYCADLVRTHDYDRYLCTLFAPASVREAWFAIFAFHCEISTIAGKVSEEMTGLMRFAWWDEALDEIYASATVRAHPVVQQLAQAVREHRLPRAPFDRMLNACRGDLPEGDFAGPSGWEAYCHDTSSALLQLCACATETPFMPELDSLGLAWGIMSLIQRGQERNTVELRQKAEACLQPARSMSASLFTPFVQVCEFYLKRLQAQKNSPVTPFGQLQLAWTLWRRNAFNW